MIIRNCFVYLFSALLHLHTIAGLIGGQTLADAMAHNFRIRELCLVDNKVGYEVMTLLAARMRGTVGETCHCMRATELEVPAIHWEKRVREAKH